MEQYQKRAEAQYNADVDAHELRLAQEGVKQVRELTIQIRKMVDAGREPSAIAAVAYAWFNEDDDLEEMFKLVRESERE